MDGAALARPRPPFSNGAQLWVATRVVIVYGQVQISVRALLIWEMEAVCRRSCQQGYAKEGRGSRIPAG